MKKYKKTIIISIMIGAIIAVVLCIDWGATTIGYTNMNTHNQKKEVAKNSNLNDKVYVKTIHPVVDQLLVTSSSGGQIERKEEILTYESFQGRIKSIFVEEGSHVKKGDKLLELDIAASLLQLEAQIQSNKSSLDLINKQLEFNQGRLDKMIQLEEEGVATPEEVSELQYQIDILKLQIEEKNQNLELVNRSIADIRKKSIVRSRVDGTIKKLTLQVRRTTDSKDFIRIVDTDNLYCKTYVSEKLIDTIKLYQGEKVNIEIPALNKIVQGEIVKIERQDPGTKLLYPVKIKIENMDEALTNMSATTQVIIYKNDNALLIPNKSVILDGEVTYVYKVLKDNTVARVDVKKLFYKDDLVEVEGDIKPDDRIIVEGQNKVREGNRVEIVE